MVRSSFVRGIGCAEYISSAKVEQSYRLKEKRRAGLMGRVEKVERRRDGSGSAVEAEGG